MSDYHAIELGLTAVMYGTAFALLLALFDLALSRKKD